MLLQSTIGGDNFDHPQSELTYSGSASSKKRSYMDLSHYHNLHVQSRLYKSAAATTSGRPPAPAMLVPAYSGDFMSSLSNQSIEIDTYLRLQTAQLRSGLEQLRRKHSMDLVSLVEEQATKRLRVKEAEVQNVTLRNLELEEQVRQMGSESQVWFNYAKTTESVVVSLRAKLDEVLNSQKGCHLSDVDEGYGDSGGESSVADDTASSCEGDEGRRTCRVCRENQVCVLLLPCRHLCLCKDCEARTDSCPVCNSTRNASIQVII